VCDDFLYWFCLLAESYETINHCHSTPTGKRPRVRLRTRWRDYISNLAWSCLGVEPAVLSEIAVDHEVFRVLLGWLPSRLSPKKKRARKWVNEWVCTPTLNPSGYEIVFSLLAKSECRVQIVISIFERKLAFLWKSVKRVRHRRENGIDTLKLHHNTLSKTLEKTLDLLIHSCVPCRPELLFQNCQIHHGVEKVLKWR